MWKIPLFKIYWDEDDIKSVTEAIRAGENWAVGPNIEEFEQRIAEYVGTSFCVVFNSGTSALHATLLAHGLKEGDEVIVPSFTFIATANAPLFVGAKPVFSDIEPETFGLSYEAVKEKITDKTKAILPIHFGGCPCKIEKMKELAEDHGLLLIEDAAEALGADVGGKKAGTFGDSAMLSFCQNKIITTGDGGAVVTNSRGIYERLKLVRSHGRSETSNYFSSTAYMDYITLGYNFRLSNISAALGVAQLKKVDRLISMRRENARYYDEKLKEIAEVETVKVPKRHHHVYQMYTVKVEHRDGLMKHLANKGIMSKVYFYPVHLTHFYKNVLGYKINLPVTERLASQVLTLPMYPHLSKEEMDIVVSEIKNFYQGI